MSGKSRIEVAFFELLEQKPYEKITVSELIEKAGVSRSTFYRTYTDIYDMYDKVCRHFIERFLTTALIDSLKSLPRYDEKFFENLLKLLKNQEKYISLLAGENGDKMFFERAFEIAEKCLAFLGKTMRYEDIFKIRFIIYAGVSTYVECGLNNEELPIEVMEITKQILDLK